MKIKKIKEENKGSKHSVPNLERALKILELLTKHPEGLNITDISNHLDIPMNSTFRITSTLLDFGYLFRNEGSKAFTITGKLLSLGYSVLSEQTLIEKSIDIMRLLRDEIKETVLLGIMVNHEGIVLELIPGLHSIKFWVDIGTVYPSNIAAPSKAMIAYMQPKQQKEILEKMDFKRYTKNTITNITGYKKALKEVQLKGFSTDIGEEVTGVHCVGAPIFNRNGSPIAAIWVTGPEERLPEESFDVIGEKVKEHAKLISERFGFYTEL
tara:strand:- start:89522 stop:90325 length:804 start_codon:yes stop_codon:yes gene_type:complete